MPTMTAISGANVLSPSQSAARNASEVTIVSVMPREKMSCRITFMPRDTAVLMRYKATTGMAQSMTESAATICGSRPTRSPKRRTIVIEITARMAHWSTTRKTARRKSARLRARSPAASARAMKVIIVSSRPKIPILLTRSVVAHATEKMPSAAGPSSRATRNVKIPRKFEASMAMRFVHAPRFSSAP